MKGYRHLEFEDRIKIEAWIKVKLNQSEISRMLDVSRSTISREIKRGQCDRMLDDLRIIRVYCPYTAQRDYDYKASGKGSQLKIGNDYDFVNYVEHKIINDKYSPDAIIGEIRKKGIKFKGLVCTRTLYNYIDSGDIFPNISRESLIMKGKRKRNYDKIKPVRIKKPLLRSIEDRPKEILERAECGHWEMDTVIGKLEGDNPVLLVLTERKARLEIVRKIDSKTQASVIAELDKIEREIGCLFSKYFKTMTIDNGSEFLDDIGLERSINGGKRTTVYFCHPYSSSERGSNENANKLIRRFVPKGVDINNYSYEYIADVQNWINNYPRRKLGYLTPNEAFRRDMGFVI